MITMKVEQKNTCSR